MNYRFNPQIAQERAIAQQIHEALEGDVIDQILDYTGIMNSGDDSSVRDRMTVTKLKVELDFMPRLFKMVQSVRQALHFEKEVELYITNSHEINACTHMGTTEGKPLIIEVNSALIELMTEDELRFVIGHELGHQIDTNQKLKKLIYFVYPNPEEMTPFLLKLKIRFWEQLCEIVADRYGFLAVGDLDVCVSAFFKMHSGLNLRGMNIDIDAFIKHNRQALKLFTDGDFLSLGNFDHPVDSIRIEALYLFANARSQKELDESMIKLIEAISRMSSSPDDRILPYFIASSGLLISNADGEISKEEREHILMGISNYYMFPKEILNSVCNEDILDVFNKSIQGILEINPDRKAELFGFVMDQVIADKKLNIEEVNCMIKIGTECFGYEMGDVMMAFAQRLRGTFVPSFSAICDIKNNDEGSNNISMVDNSGSKPIEEPSDEIQPSYKKVMLSYSYSFLCKNDIDKLIKVMNEEELFKVAWSFYKGIGDFPQDDNQALQWFIHSGQNGCKEAIPHIKYLQYKLS